VTDEIAVGGVDVHVVGGDLRAPLQVGQAVRLGDSQRGGNAGGHAKRWDKGDYLERVVDMGIHVDLVGRIDEHTVGDRNVGGRRGGGVGGSRGGGGCRNVRRGYPG